MSQTTTKSIRKWVTLAVSLLLVTSLIGWYLGRERLPRKIRIATGAPDGLYHKVGNTLGNSLEARLGRSFELAESSGSEENFDRLMRGDVDLAIVQGGAVPIEKVYVVTPLFLEFVFVVVRRDSGISSVWEMKGKRVCLGEVGSGSRVVATQVLDHFGVKPDDLVGNNKQPFTAMRTDESIDAAIVTAGIEHPALRRLLATNQFDILPIRSARAMEWMHPFLRNVEIPRGLFAEHPAVPEESIPTIATTAYLVSRDNAADTLVQASLQSIHEESLRLEVPTLIARQDAPQSTATRMHPTAQLYFNPEDNIGQMVSVMESLVATKELLFALGAGLYLLWTRYRRLKEQELQVLFDRQKEHLDRFLKETLDIERAQMQVEDVDQLKAYLDSVTRIKLRALKELTEEELRGNQVFSIFLDQCSSLISKIQLKIVSAQRGQN